MLQKKMRRSFRKKITVYILFLTILGLLILVINLFFLPENFSFISPLGKANIDRNKVEKILKDNNIVFSQILVLSDFSYEVTIPNNGQVKLSSGKDIYGQITSLQRILRELTIEGKPFKSIDFRFNEPIISF